MSQTKAQLIDGKSAEIEFSGGSANTPAISFTGDTNTGIYSPGADQLALSTNGTQRVTVDADGNVLIGVDSSVGVGQLQIADLNALGKLTLARNDTTIIAGNAIGATYFYSNAGGVYGQCGEFNCVSEGTHTATSKPAFLSFRTTPSGTAASTERLRITSAGLVGIGTASPSAKLDVSGGGQFTSGTYCQVGVTSGAVQGQIAANESSSAVDLRAVSNHPLRIFTNNQERAQIDSSGRLLVGTSSARSNFFNSSISAAFQIEGAASSTRIASITSSINESTSSGRLVLAHQRSGTIGGNTILQSNDAVGGISFQGSDGTEFVPCADITAEVDGTPGSNDMPGRLVFSTTADGASSPTERARITSKGYFQSSTTGSYSSSSYSLFQTDTTDWYALGAFNTAASPYGLAVRFTGASPNNATNQFIYCRDSTANRFIVMSNGGVHNYSANNVNLSDRNAKKDIALAAGTWDCVKEWEIVNFRYKEQPADSDLSMGVIAQQVAQSCPEVVTVFQEAKEATEDQPAQEERLGVKDQQMVWMAIKALQEAQVRIETLEAEVAALKAQ